LMPQPDMLSYREAFEHDRTRPPGRELVQQLQVYFSTDNQVVLWRLLSLGWTDPAGVERLLTDAGGLLPEIDLEQIDGDERLDLGRPIRERYIHWVAAAFGKGKIELPEAAEYLEGGIEEARHVLGQFKYESPAEGGQAPGKKPAASVPRRDTPEPPETNMN